MIRGFLAGCGMLFLLLAPNAHAQDDLARAVRETYLTNLAMLSEAADSAVNEMFLNFTFPKGATVLLEAESNHEARWFVENLLLERLTERGYRVHLKGGLQRPGSAAQATPNETDPVTGGGGLADLMKQAQTDSTTAEPAPPSAEPDPSPNAQPEATRGVVTDYVFRFRVAECSLIYPRSYRKSPLGSRTVQRLATVSLFGTLVSGAQEDVVWVGRGDAERLDHVPGSKLPLLEGNSYPFTQPALESRGLGAYVEPALVLAIVLGLVYLFYTNQ